MKSKQLRTLLIILFVFIIASLRFFLVDFANFAPIAAAGIFAMYYFRNKWLAVAIPLIALFCSDLLLQFQNGNALYAGRMFDYVGLLCSMAIAYLLFKNSKQWLSVFSAVVFGSLAFFIISNFSVWAFGTMYVKSFDGLVQCYINAIPFYRATFAGDLLFSVVFFALFELMMNSFPSLSLEN